jgi:hypothetical protein
MASDSDSGAASQPASLREAVIRLLHPIPLTILLILVGVTLLIGANVIGWDNGNVLTRMSTHEFARGLITYLFAVTTIGTSVVLVLAALMREISEEAYTRGKEILALLLGVFGTIVGFYFGQEAGAAREMPELSITQPLLSASVVPAGGSVGVTAWVSGGTGPYRFAIGAGDASTLVADRPVAASGWIVDDVTVPDAAVERELPITLAVQDSSGRSASALSVVRVTPATASPPANPR